MKLIKYIKSYYPSLLETDGSISDDTRKEMMSDELQYVPLINYTRYSGYMDLEDVDVDPDAFTDTMASDLIAFALNANVVKKANQKDVVVYYNTISMYEIHSNHKIIINMNNFKSQDSDMIKVNLLNLIASPIIIIVNPTKPTDYVNNSVKINEVDNYITTIYLKDSFAFIDSRDDICKVFISDKRIINLSLLNYINYTNNNNPFKFTIFNSVIPHINNYFQFNLKDIYISNKLLFTYKSKYDIVDVIDKSLGIVSADYNLRQVFIDDIIGLTKYNIGFIYCTPRSGFNKDVIVYQKICV